MLGRIIRSPWSFFRRPTDQPFPLADLDGPGPRARISGGQEDPIFITARYRTGSTFLWNLFDQTEGVTAYYEPLHERRWFSPTHRGDLVDETHRAVTSYWQAYEGLEDLDSVFSENWSKGRFYMDAESEDAGLESYIGALNSRASGRPVLQFNRVDFRLAWLRARFPRARIVHLHRNPRDQWMSMLGTESLCTKNTRLDEFAIHDRYFLRGWGRDLSQQFPFLKLAKRDTPYALHYLIWRLSHSCGMAFADLSFSYEALIQNPASINAALEKSVGQSFDMIRCEEILSPAEQGLWENFADATWYEATEESCEKILRAAFLADA